MLAVVVLIAVLAYLMFMQPQAPQVSEAGKLLAQSQVALKGVVKESFTYEGTVAIDSEGGVSIKLPVSGEGKIDTVNERMYFKINMESPQVNSVSEQGGTVFETYTVGTTVYMNYADTWAKYSGYDKLWEGSEFSKKLVDFSTSFESKVTKKEKVNGKDTIKVTINPTLEQMANELADIAPGLSESMGVSSFEGVEKDVKSIVMDVWIDQTTFLPVKVGIDIKVQTQSLNPAGSGVVNTAIVLSGTASFDYDTPFNIVLPSAAKDAIEIS